MESSDIKDEMRREVRSRLTLMTGEAMAEASARICGALGAIEWVRGASCVMVYDALDDEPDLSAFAAAALAGGKTVCYPRIDWDRKVLTPVAVETHEFPRLSHRHGVREPTEGRAVPAAEVDLVIAPGVAFDGTGARLGRGGGFYDRFLASLIERVEARGDSEEGRRARRAAHAIGVCFDCQRAERIPSEAHDAKVDSIVTERGVFVCRA